MAADRQKVEYLVFDVEAIADGELISRIRYPGQNLAPNDAVRKYRDELMEQNGSDFIPHTFMLPISVAVGKIDSHYRLLEVTTLDAPDYRPYHIAKRFWQGMTHYGSPTLVTFNGRGYDLPVLELAAYRFGISLPTWFNLEGPSYTQARNRYNVRSHIDLMDLFSNYGACRLSGGLNLLANLIGKPGKTGIDGSMVQDFYEAGDVEKINDYCRSDVLDTYFVFLRSRVLLGMLTLDEEQGIVAETKTMLEQHAAESPATRHYLDHWGDWQPPE